MKSKRLAQLTFAGLISAGSAFGGNVTIPIAGPNMVDPIRSAKFHVCSVTGQTQHGGVMGAHLLVGDKVSVEKNDTFGEAVLAEDDAYRRTELALVGDEKALLATKKLPHIPQPQDHLVVLTLIEAGHVMSALGGVPTGCDSGKALLEINFCFQHKSSPAAKPKWKCKSDDADYGHVHAQEF